MKKILVNIVILALFIGLSALCVPKIEKEAESRKNSPAGLQLAEPYDQPEARALWNDSSLERSEEIIGYDSGGIYWNWVWSYHPTTYQISVETEKGRTPIGVRHQYTRAFLFFGGFTGVFGGAIFLGAAAAVFGMTCSGFRDESRSWTDEIALGAVLLLLLIGYYFAGHYSGIFILGLPLVGIFLAVYLSEGPGLSTVTYTTRDGDVVTRPMV